MFLKLAPLHCLLQMWTGTSSDVYSGLPQLIRSRIRPRSLLLFLVVVEVGVRWFLVWFGSFISYRGRWCGALFPRSGVQVIFDNGNPFVMNELERGAWVLLHILWRVFFVGLLDCSLGLNFYLEVVALEVFLQSFDLLVHEICQPRLGRAPGLGHMRLPRVLKSTLGLRLCAFGSQLLFYCAHRFSHPNYFFPKNFINLWVYQVFANDEYIT
jgi:hypothetical protein